MGVQAKIYSITPDAYASVLRGDLDGFDVGCGEVVADLDKAWHAIHFLITGNSEWRLLNGGIQVADMEEQFEAHKPEAIQDLHAQLAATSVQALMAKFDPELFHAKQIYPSQLDETWRDYVEENLERFLTTIKQAADEGKGIAVLLV